MTSEPARNENSEVMGGPEPNEQETDVMEGTDPNADSDVMDRPGQDRPAE
jgi:hypothetical protein